MKGREIGLSDVVRQWQRTIAIADRVEDLSVEEVLRRKREWIVECRQAVKADLAVDAEGLYGWAMDLGGDDADSGG